MKMNVMLPLRNTSLLRKYYKIFPADIICTNKPNLSFPSVLWTGVNSASSQSSVWTEGHLCPPGNTFTATSVSLSCLFQTGQRWAAPWSRGHNLMSTTLHRSPGWTRVVLTQNYILKGRSGPFLLGIKWLSRSLPVCLEIYCEIVLPWYRRWISPSHISLCRIYRSLTTFSYLWL